MKTSDQADLLVGARTSDNIPELGADTGADSETVAMDGLAQNEDDYEEGEEYLGDEIPEVGGQITDGYEYAEYSPQPGAAPVPQYEVIENASLILQVIHVHHFDEPDSYALHLLQEYSQDSFEMQQHESQGMSAGYYP